MGRRLFNIFAAVSLLLCVGVMYCWIASSLYFELTPTGIVMAWMSEVSIFVRYRSPDFLLTEQLRVDWMFLGFQYLYADVTPRISGVLVPYWFVVLSSAIAPIIWLRSFMQRARRQRESRCLTCGYDLRASTECCPECGTAIRATPTAVAASPADTPTL